MSVMPEPEVVIEETPPFEAGNVDGDRPHEPDGLLLDASEAASRPE